MAQSDTSNFPM